MEKTVTTEKDLGQALKEKVSTIIIEGSLKDKVIRIRATGKVAWLIAGGAIAIAIAIVISSAGTAAPVAALVGGTTVGILGLPAAIAATSIGVAAGGFAALNRLRRYKEFERSENRLVLKMK
ncbi:MAG: hypothetical protein C4520_03980 [Candidatus Abyssobacteria bacterium SURF_5]|uniref:Uncharacterized protein n=1 Tax=Abyssobacteria bacterium (strain SURF_5) TaxID=2093360 RepID=A0A3A4P944_ABYX5|nr:MAG: hypothetical protein C4520_03980 [Candidatus Abyssubacteria bacterium SURF_5]